MFFGFLVGCTVTSDAQVTISGHIRTPDSLPVPQASILLHNVSIPEKPLVSFTTSDSKGFYSLKVENTEAAYRLTVKASARQTVERPVDLSSGASALHEDFVLYSSVSFLDTVKVDIRVAISQTGDTITFNPDAFTLKNETNIEDMLKRLPGMEVKEDGKVYFNGKLISNVLIDGDDLFKKDYQLLTKNAAPKIVDKVQVIKNYQKDLLLKEFNQAGGQVINLKIKDQYKNYLFGNMTAGYGTSENRVGDLFLIRLSPKTKVQAGVNYNTIGTTYNSTGKFNAAEFLQNENLFFSYQPAGSLLSLSRYYYPNIPDHYQQRNKSLQAHSNLLMKKNNWEILLNAKYAEDHLKQNQQSGTTYQDGTYLYNDDAGTLKEQAQDYKITVSKSSKEESVYINASLQYKQSNYGLQTESNRSLESMQKLLGDNLNWQLNLNYNRRVGGGMLWATTFGLYDQDMNENLQTNPDFLFWLFPDDLSLYKLKSDAITRLQYLNLKSSLQFSGRRMSHEIAAIYSSEKRHIQSGLRTEELNNGHATSPFLNNDYLNTPNLSLRYEGKLPLPKKNQLTFKATNEPWFYKFENPSSGFRKSKYFYDYSAGWSSRGRTTNAGITLGVKKKAVSQNLFFSDFIQTSFHRIQEGRMDPDGEKSTYFQANYNLFSVKLGWIAFFMMNASRNQRNYISHIETKGIATVNSFLYHPHTTNQMFLVFNSQKTMGDWPFALNTNLMYNRQSFFNSFNNVINKSETQFLNTTLGFKSLFKSVINFDYSFMWMYSRNKIMRTNPFTTNAYSLLNKVNVHLTPKKWFNTTLTFNNMISNRGAFDGSFLDVKFNRKFMKERWVVEVNVRNIFDKDYLSNTAISSYYTQKNRVEIRGAEFFMTLRYEIR